MEGINVAASGRTMMVPLSDMLRPQYNAGDKIALPVANYTPWANFQYVQGVPAGADGGYSISKLQILDTIIGNLVSLKDKSVLSQIPEDPASLNPARIDGLIRDLAGKLQVASTASKPGLSESIGSSFGMAISQTGAAVNILA
jgi:hypothetical protein